MEKYYYIESRRKGTSYKITRGKANRIGHIVHVNCLIKHVIEGREKDGSDGKKIRRRKQLLDGIWKRQDTGPHSLEALLWKTHMNIWDFINYLTFYSLTY